MRCLDPATPAGPRLARGYRARERRLNHLQYLRERLRVDDVVCSGEPDRIYVLRGFQRSQRIKETGRNAPALVGRITSPDCPVSAALTADDKAALHRLAETLGEASGGK